MKKALIIGCNGQDGRLLHESLVTKGCQVTGIARISSQTSSAEWQQPLDISDPEAVSYLIRTQMPDEIYYLAAFHHAAENVPAQNNLGLFGKSFQVHVHSLINFLEAMRLYSRKTRLFYAASSHVFGNALREPQDESTPFNPNCVYGITKTAGLHTCRFYRNQYKLFVAAGILYNHESHYRKPVFVTKKIINGAINIKNERQDNLILGNLDAEVDWGYAPDYVEAFQRILSAPLPDDFIVATGIKHTVRDFLEITFGYLGLDWKKYVVEDKTIIAKSGVSLIGNAGKLMGVTGWKPSVDLAQMIKLLLTEEGIQIKE